LPGKGKFKVAGSASSMIVLGIETSCDETAAALVERRADGSGRILSDVVLSQTDAHAVFGGVVPEIAARAHVEALDGIIAKALADAGLGFADIDAVAATAGPGLIGGVLVGLVTGKAIALAAGKPLVAVNHLEGHALTARLTDGVAFPYLLLLVSGGHSQFVAVEGVGQYRRLGGTIDDALGEAFDKAAKLLGLGYPGGPQIERLAREGDAARFDLPRPLAGRPGADFSFSGLKTALRLAAEQIAPLSDKDVADLAASFQAAVTDVVCDRAAHAIRAFLKMQRDEGAITLPLREGRNAEGVSGRGVQSLEKSHPSPRPLRGFDPPARGGLSGELADTFSGTLVVAGGVAANQALRSALADVAGANGFRLVAPPLRLCSDNAVMIAWAGAERLALGLTDDLGAPALPRWPLEALRGEKAA
jgi:N6-L-threonylcarbamoyladenine synthase